jgi:AcrR family transcriptional regulator
MDEPTPARPKVANPPATKKGKRSAEAFRVAASEVFAELGFLNATVADIAKKAHRSPAAFYYHYDSKEGILLALFEDFTDSINKRAEAVFDPQAPPRVQIDQLCRNYWLMYQEWLPVLTGVFQQSMVDAEFHEHWRAIRVNNVLAIRSWVRAAQRRGFAADLDADLAASALGAMLDGFCYMWLARGGDLPRFKLDSERAQRTLVALCYNGLYGDRSSDDDRS